MDAAGEVGYVKLNSFTQTAGNDVRTAVKELKDQGAKKMILDLRGNGGGLLREAVNIVNLFVPKGETVVETKGKMADWDKTYKTLSEPFDAEMPLVVLTDTGSASASEIVSGALQDLDRAVVMGQRTYGKGLVQQTRDLFYNSKLKVTVAKYYIPSGRCIQKLDYAKHDSTGHAVIKADSLIRDFTTRNGRPVIDGRGITPDVLVPEPDMPKVVGGLYTSDVFFDFANRYFWTHDSIAAPDKFSIDEATWTEFMAFVKDRKVEYRTESNDKLKLLEEAAKKERYYEHAKSADRCPARGAEPGPHRGAAALPFGHRGSVAQRDRGPLLLHHGARQGHAGQRSPCAARGVQPQRNRPRQHPQRHGQGG